MKGGIFVNRKYVTRFRPMIRMDDVQIYSAQIRCMYCHLQDGCIADSFSSLGKLGNRRFIHKKNARSQIDYEHQSQPS